MRILTLNAGLLSLFSGRVETVPQIRARLGALSRQLRTMDADLILLQEVYSLAHRNQIALELAEDYPWSAYQRWPSRFRLDSSLMSFSRHPMSADLRLFRGGPLHERLFDQKGFLICRIRREGNAPLTVLNIHTTAGGLWGHPENLHVEKLRSRQIKEALQVAWKETVPTILAGDLNAGPGVSEWNFESVKKGGFESVHDWLNQQPTEISWDPSNRLNTTGPHRFCPPQRIDHIFLRKSDIESLRLTPLGSGMCLTEEFVRGDDGENYTVSDHFGLWADVEVCG